MANKQELKFREEKRIIKEIKDCGIKGEVSLYPQEVDVRTLSFDEKHIAERQHGVTHKEAESYIKNALFASKRWNGEFMDFYSEEGATYVNLKTNLIRTAFKKEEFTLSVKKAMEVLKKYGK